MTPALTPVIVRRNNVRGERMRERYLSIPEVADRLGSSERFPRRLIEERRIEYVKIGRHVRIAESVLEAFIELCKVMPLARSAHSRKAS